MRDIERIDKICDGLKEVWREVPDWRFTQMLVNFMSEKRSDCFYMEDEKFLEELKHYISSIKVVK